MRTRRSHRRRLVLAFACAAALIAHAGCGLDPAEPVERRSPGDLPMTESQYVEFMAALNVALEEGLTGEDALERARELGATVFDRNDVEVFIDHLRETPADWSRVERRVEERIAELRTEPAESP